MLAKKLRDSVLDSMTKGLLGNNNSAEMAVTIKPAVLQEDFEKVDYDNWCYARLQDISPVIDCPHSTPTYVDGFEGFKCLRTKELKPGKIEWDKLNDISEATYEERTTRYAPLLGDIVYAREGNYGVCAIIDKDIPLALGQRLVVIPSNRNAVLPDYLFYVLRSPFCISQALEKQKGMTAVHVNVKDIRNFIIPLPPLAEQHRIVARVDELMSKIDEYEKLENRLAELKKKFPEEMKASILQAAMEGKLTTHEPTDTDVTETLNAMETERRELFNNKKAKACKPTDELSYSDLLFDIPSHWKWVKLGDIGTLTRGKGIKRTEVTEAGLPCVRYGELYTTYRTSFSTPISHIPENVFADCVKATENDVLMSLTGENNVDIALAVSYLGKEEIAIGGDMTKWSNHYMNPLYLTAVLNSSYGISCKSKMAKGNIIVHISNDKLANIMIPVPPVEEQQRIVDKLDRLLPLCDELAELA